MGFACNSTNPTNCFYEQQQNENSLIVENKFNPIHGRPCVHPGTKSIVLFAYLHIFIEIIQQSDPFPLLTSIKTNKTKTLFSVFLLNVFFSQKGD